MENPGNRLSKKTLFAYGCGDFASNLCWTFVGSYLSVFYTDVVGMAPAIASMIMLIAKIWDGVNDPMFGMIAERTNSKKGRFRPYIFYGAPFLALFSVLTFTTFGKGSAAVGWAAFSYIGCGMLYTVVNLSYGSLSTVMTTNAEDIAQLNSYRMMGTNISSVLLNAIKVLGNIDKNTHLISRTFIEPIQHLKTGYLGSKNPRLHTDEVLIALSMCAVSDPNAKHALEQLPKLSGCQLHVSSILSTVDMTTFKKLGIELTNEAVYEGAATQENA